MCDVCELQNNNNKSGVLFDVFSILYDLNECILFLYGF